MASLGFDHVIVTVTDLDVAAAQFRDNYGLASVAGGRHSGHGTANRIVPLGPSYIELMAIVDEREAEGSPLGLWVKTLSANGNRLAALCLQTDDIQSIADRLGLTPMAMSRSNDDGSLLSWRLAGLERALIEPPHPFFIEWDDPKQHPGSLVAPHEVEPLGIWWVELAGSENSVQAWLGPHDLDLRFVPGEPGIARVGVSTEAGELVLTAS